MGSGFESQGAHFTENPADSSESAGFLRSLNKYSFVVRGAYILFAPAGDPSSQSSDTLMSRQRIYAPLCVSVFGVRFGPVGVAVDVRWFSTCAPCLANCGGGRLSRFSVLHGGWMFRLVRRVFRKRPQGVTRTLSAAKQGGAERPGAGCPCVGAEETCGVAASTHTQ